MAVFAILRIKGMTEAGCQLTQKQREDLQEKTGELRASSGGKVVARYRSYDDGETVTITSFPSIDACEKNRIATWSSEGQNLSRYYRYERRIFYELPVKP